MTKLLQSALSEISQLPDEEQDEIASWLLAELASERRWRSLFDRSPSLLAKMASEALAEHRAGNSVELTPEAL